MSETFQFKAETQQLLHILIHSLYKDREVFLRELLSNASDALNRLRFEMLTNKDVLDPEAPLEIRIQADKDARTLTISDTGIGMTREEIIEHLGTIAQSGARRFLEAARQQNFDTSGLIGQFGVGFYSVFMVAESVTVTSRSHKREADPVRWTCRGDDRYQVEAAEKDQRGTEIRILLKEDAAEFAEEYRLREIIRKHSDYIAFPIYVGTDEKPVNKQTSLWRTPKTQIGETQYTDFYRQMTLDFEEPLLSTHFVTDAPVQMYALLYIPAKGERGLFSLRKEDGLKLYSRNILIDEYNKDLLPEYLRFVQGVVDSEDLPLNVSRETVQSSGLMPRLKKVLTSQVLKELESLSKNDPEKYASFWKEFGGYLKQGVAAVPADAEKLTPLLRFRTNTYPDSWSSLEDYAGRMKEGQKFVYYLLGEDPRSLLRSPHLEAFQAQGLEVLLLTEPIDSFMLMGLRKYGEYELKNAAQAEIEAPTSSTETRPEAEKIPEAELSPLIERFKQTLGERVSNVRVSGRLLQSVARLVDPEGALNPEMQRVYKFLGKEYEAPKKILELNPSHPILKALSKLPAESELAEMVIEQIYDSALLVEGLHPDPASMAPRVQKLIEAALMRS
ncbi:MAG: molecular chaperone HtpG [Anaerolineales bacterium]|nr:molecular chaperone HtpG [Anaerolineales bacterium]MDW8277854.1 molecular chaperone HtpG [Anaerolineales bacterium]